MIKSEFIEKVKAYLEQNPEERNLAEGALLVLQLTNNRIMYQNFMRKPKVFASRIEYELKKKYQFYLQQLTHDEVKEMAAKVEVIAKENHLTAEEKEHEEFKKGKRSDHDELPEEIQALYARNLSIMQQMRRVHTQLQLLSVENSTCPDSERYPFLKELISLDKQYHENWKQYDHYKMGEPLPAVKEEEAPADAERPSDETEGAASAEKGNAAQKVEEQTPADAPAEPANTTPVKKAAKPKAAKTTKAKAKASK